MKGDGVLAWPRPTMAAPLPPTRRTPRSSPESRSQPRQTKTKLPQRPARRGEHDRAQIKGGEHVGTMAPRRRHFHGLGEPQVRCYSALNSRLKVWEASRGYHGSVGGDCSVRQSSERLDHGRGGLEREEYVDELEFVAYKINTKEN